MRLSQSQEDFLDTAIECGAGGMAIVGGDWSTARSLARMGFGTLEGTPMHRGGSPGMFTIAEGAAERLHAYRQVGISPFAQDPLYAQRAIATAAELVGCSPEQLIEQGPRKRPQVRGRWAVMLVLTNRGASQTAIGRRLRRDHSSVGNGLRNARHLLTIDPEFAAIVAKVDAV